MLDTAYAWLYRFPSWLLVKKFRSSASSEFNHRSRYRLLLPQSIVMEA